MIFFSTYSQKTLKVAFIIKWFNMEVKRDYKAYKGNRKNVENMYMCVHAFISSFIYYSWNIYEEPGAV